MIRALLLVCLTSCGASAALPENDDARFLDHMIEMHQQGVEMSQLAEQRGESLELRKLSQRMTEEQGAELAEMREWRKQSYSRIKPTSEPVPQVDTDRLRFAQGSEFDHKYIDLMCKHHLLSVRVAEEAAAKTADSRVKAYASTLADKQNAEMRELHRLKGLIR